MIQGTHFKRKKKGGQTSTFFAMDLNAAIPLAGSDFVCKYATFDTKTTPLSQQFYSIFSFSTMYQPILKLKTHITSSSFKLLMHNTQSKYLGKFKGLVGLFRKSIQGLVTCKHPKKFFFCPQNPFPKNLDIFWLFCTNQGSNGMLVWSPLQKENYNIIFKMLHSVIVFWHISRVSMAPVSTSTYFFSLKMCLYGWQNTIEDF